MINTSITDNDEINNALLGLGKKSKLNNFKNTVTKYAKSAGVTVPETKQTKAKQPKTHTENLTKEEIVDLLEDYSQVKHMKDVAIGTHLRYFSKVGNENKFRMGGNLKLIENEYVILKNAVGVEWSVQMNGTTFYKKMTNKDIKNEYDIIINDLHDKIKKLKADNKALKSEITDFKNSKPVKTPAKTPKATKKK